MISVPGTDGTIFLGGGIIGAGIIGEERVIGLGEGEMVIGFGEGAGSTFVNSGRGEFRITSVIFSVSRGLSISTISPSLFTYRTVGTPDTDFF
jgi:hypothetical protein